MQVSKEAELPVFEFTAVLSVFWTTTVYKVVRLKVERALELSQISTVSIHFVVLADVTRTTYKHYQLTVAKRQLSDTKNSNQSIFPESVLFLSRCQIKPWYAKTKQTVMKKMKQNLKGRQLQCKRCGVHQKSITLQRPLILIMYIYLTLEHITRSIYIIHYSGMITNTCISYR